MKKLNFIRKLLAVTASAALLAFLPNVNALTASADEPVTYYVMYKEDEQGSGDWWYQVGSWNTEAEGNASYYMHEKIKDGDIVVIGNASAKSMLTLDVHLSNLTINNTSGTLAMVSVTGGVDNCYFLKGTQGAVTGNVLNAYVYGGALANFNSNVTNLYSYNDNSDAKPTIGVSGTVSYFTSEDPDDPNSPYGTNFAAGSFYLEDGELKTDSSQYTRDISGGPASSGSQHKPQTTSKPAASGSSASSEYDAVPKTGEASPAAWLSLIAVTCLSISLILRKSARQ